MKHCTACKLDYPDSVAERPVCTAALTGLELEAADNPGFEQNRSIMDAFLPKCWNIVGGLTWGLGIIAAIWLGLLIFLGRFPSTRLYLSAGSLLFLCLGCSVTAFPTL